ncbi:hypothetical protein [Streptomyces scabiei]|uniref:hypothetical protein n=1 Tax=Streptomyces scabiei TaxID=1930 RepID=UPI000765B5D4|nr:hypothetical protein [Streptomyces scabiei]
MTVKAVKVPLKETALNRNTVQPGRPLLLSKPHKLRSTATTKITPGPHTVAIQVNGRRFPAVPFGRRGAIRDRPST